MSVATPAIQNTFVIPAKAGTPLFLRQARGSGTPAFAGATSEGVEMHGGGAAL
jgi:hypothetical protein